MLFLDGLVFHAGGLGSDKSPRRVITLADRSVDELLQDEDLRSRILVRGQRIYRVVHIPDEGGVPWVDALRDRFPP